MAAKTPSTIRQESMGSSKLLIATFTDIDATDTWTSSLSGVKAQWFNRTDVPTLQTSAGVAVGQSAGVFTFTPAEDDAAGYLFIML